MGSSPDYELSYVILSRKISYPFHNSLKTYKFYFKTSLSSSFGECTSECVHRSSLMRSTLRCCFSFFLSFVLAAGRHFFTLAVSSDMLGGASRCRAHEPFHIYSSILSRLLSWQANEWILHFSCFTEFELIKLLYTLCKMKMLCILLTTLLHVHKRRRYRRRAYKYSFC